MQDSRKSEGSADIGGPDQKDSHSPPAQFVIDDGPPNAIAAVTSNSVSRRDFGAMDPPFYAPPSVDSHSSSAIAIDVAAPIKEEGATTPREHVRAPPRTIPAGSLRFYTLTGDDKELLSRARSRFCCAYLPIAALLVCIGIMLAERYGGWFGAPLRGFAPPFILGTRVLLISRVSDMWVWVGRPIEFILFNGHYWEECSDYVFVMAHVCFLRSFHAIHDFCVRSVISKLH